MGDIDETSYDEIPYEGQPFPQTHPDRLALVARLFGVDAAPPDCCRVLELGCTDGGNLAPMAATLPGSTFLGIDLSRRQVAAGQKLIERLALTNLELRHMNIADVGEDFGSFDYIICHGVYSWVPAPVQDKILDICQQHLNRCGVAYVSYNAYPGWHLRGMIRDMTYYHARQFSDRKTRVRQARNLLEFLAKSAASETTPYGLLLRDELKIFQRAPDSYVCHEHLEEVNEPLYFHQFAERAAQKRLQYLGEADLCAMAPSNFPAEVQEVLRMLAADVIHLEQYMDFLRNRTFRQTLLCHDQLRLSRRLWMAPIGKFYAASPAKPVAEQLDLGSFRAEQFRTAGGLVISVNHPLCKAALLHLAEIWPRYASVSDLRRHARQRLASGVADGGAESEDLEILGQCLLSGYTAASGSAIVDLRVSPPRHTFIAGLRPIGAGLVRTQAAAGNRVTNLRHEPLQLNELERRLLTHLDGTKGRPELVEILMGLVDRGELNVEQNGQKPDSPARTRELLARAVDSGLTKLANLALLITPDSSETPGPAPLQPEILSFGDNIQCGGEVFQQALNCHKVGRLHEAADLCRGILHAEPRHADAAFLLGVIAHQTGDYVSAVEHIQRAVALAPNEGRYHGGLGLAQMRLRRTDQAEESLRRAVALDESAEAHNNLGNFLKDQKRIIEATDEYRQALELNPQYANAHYNPGDALWMKGELEQAAGCFERAATDGSVRAVALPSLGKVLLSLGCGKKAEEALRAALALSPGDAALQSDLGDALQAQGLFDEAADFYRKSLELDPTTIHTWYSLGCVEISREQYAAAVLCLREAMRIEPDLPEVQQNLGQALFNLGEADEAVELFRQAAQRSALELPWESLATTIPMSPRADNQTVLETRREWAQRYLPPPRPAERFSARRTGSARALRIGYVSSFFHHDNWMKPVWALIHQHDRRQFEIHLFGDMPASAVEHNHRADARDQFHDLTGITVKAAADLIEEKAIDILVDLNNFSAPRWLPLMALRPAPLIVGWFNAFATTGMSCYDYLIGDCETVPPEEERFYCEKIVRVPGSYLTFAVEYPVPEVSAPPCGNSRAITFGCLASQYKINSAVMSAWARILRQAPMASLIVKNACLGSRVNREFVEQSLRRHDFPLARVRLEGPADHYEFLKTYGKIDVALDTFPYNGGTTTTEAIWQGVPVVTFRGDRWASRTSTSILRGAGLGEFIASDVQEYVSLATRWANSADSPEELGKLRREMRSRLRAALVCDAQGFARNMERLYLQIWERWCRSTL